MKEKRSKKRYSQDIPAQLEENKLEAIEEEDMKDNSSQAKSRSASLQRANHLRSVGSASNSSQKSKLFNSVSSINSSEFKDKSSDSAHDSLKRRPQAVEGEDRPEIEAEQERNDA